MRADQVAKLVEQRAVTDLLLFFLLSLILAFFVSRFSFFPTSFFS